MNKDRQFERLHTNFQSLSEKVMQQYNLLENLIKDSADKDILVQIENNENIMDILENEVRVEFINSLTLFTPRAKDLRKLVAYQDITNFLEKAGDLLLETSLFLAKIDFSLPDFENFLVSLGSLLDSSKNLLTSAIFSFYYEDKTAALRVISEKRKTEETYKDLEETIFANYQELPLTEQELRNIIYIHSIARILVQVSGLGINTAESAMYFIDGIDIRHKERGKE